MKRRRYQTKLTSFDNLNDRRKLRFFGAYTADSSSSCQHILRKKLGRNGLRYANGSHAGGLIADVDAKDLANEIVTQDAKEITDKHGQNVRDAFPLGDVFIDASTRAGCENMVRRFIQLLFGSNEFSPTHDEYGMYMAKSASLRSSDLSRQVGAAIFSASGEVVTMGCNEVPKSGGGTYWSGDAVDKRDFVQGHDPNERKKIELLVDLLDRLKKGGHLSDALMSVIDPYEISERLLKDKSEHSVSECTDDGYN